MSRTEAIERAVSAIESRISKATDVAKHPVAPAGVAAMMETAIKHDHEAIAALNEMAQEAP